LAVDHAADNTHVSIVCIRFTLCYHSFGADIERGCTMETIAIFGLGILLGALIPVPGAPKETALTLLVKLVRMILHEL
jgi:hypothetical protein